jgi:hypothetical protein
LLSAEKARVLMLLAMRSWGDSAALALTLRTGALLHRRGEDWKGATYMGTKRSKQPSTPWCKLQAAS